MPQDPQAHRLSPKLDSFVVIRHIDIDDLAFDKAAGVHDYIDSTIVTGTQLDYGSNGKYCRIRRYDTSLNQDSREGQSVVTVGCGFELAKVCRLRFGEFMFRSNLSGFG